MTKVITFWLGFLELFLPEQYNKLKQVLDLLQSDSKVVDQFSQSYQRIQVLIGV